MTFSLTFKSAAALAALAFFLVPSLQAQQVYRIVGADGRITFSDKPPAETNSKVVAGNGSGGGAGPAGSPLPFELRQIVSRYPVTLYTGDACNPCGAARSMLVSRGVPFTEKTVNTAEDAQSLQRLSGDTSMPFATIGGQQLKGFSDSEWTQFLNAAGYPATSVLPSSYRPPSPTPLVALSAAPSGAGATTTSPVSAAVRPAARPAAPVANNPAGIQF